SAVTYDLQALRVNIQTHWTVYNMLGFYEKKTSSKYAYARKMSASYDISENTQIGVNYERITKDYKSLGSLMFDHNFEAYTFNYSSAFLNNKINLSSDIGVRKDGIENESEITGNRIIGNISVGYSPVESLHFTSS